MRKKLYLLTIVFIVVLIGLAMVDSDADYVCGDANSDGTINVSDAVYIINYVFVGGDPPDPGCCGDCPSTVTDIDGNVYLTVLIGDQCWMAENLKVTHFRNGDPLSSWWNYDYDEVNGAIYGKLYNWYVVDDSRNIAPEGWHVPSNVEWQTLADYLGGDTIAGGKIKQAGTLYWDSPNTGATNESGFTGLPGGMRFTDGTFSFMGVIANFWSTTEYDGSQVWYWRLGYSSSEIWNYTDYKSTGFSVRCIKDQFAT